MNSASFDLSISALVLILDISGLTIRQNQVVMQVVNWPYVASPHADVPMGFVRHTFISLGKKWMCDKWTPQDVCGEANHTRLIRALQSRI